MPDKPFKKFERETADLLGGKRYWANSGEAIDVEAPTVVAQCKLVQRLSLEALSQLAELAASQGRPKGKLGLVAVKVRRGAGIPSQGLIVMTFEMWRRMHPVSVDV
jgi:hypothetical protein